MENIEKRMTTYLEMATEMQATLIISLKKSSKKVSALGIISKICAMVLILLNE